MPPYYGAPQTGPGVTENTGDKKLIRVRVAKNILKKTELEIKFIINNAYNVLKSVSNDLQTIR